MSDDKVGCAAVTEDEGRCSRPAVAGGFCAVHVDHSVVTPHADQPMPTHNDKSALWPLVMRGFENSKAELARYVDSVVNTNGQTILRELYLMNMMQVALLAHAMGKSVDDILADMQKRHEFGTKKYGTSLQPFNGRDALKDAYDELLDGQVYLRQKLFEDGHEED